MACNDFLTGLRGMLPEESSAEILSALSQDPVIWSSLDDPEFSHVALGYAGTDKNKWSPASLALLSLGNPISQPELCLEPLMPLATSLGERVNNSLAEAIHTFAPPTTLAESGLLALALREYRRSTGAWDGLLDKLAYRKDTATDFVALWRTPLACAFAMVPDPMALLKAFTPEGSLEWLQENISLVLHAFFSNALLIADQATWLEGLIGKPDIQMLTTWLEKLAQWGHSELASSMANHYLDFLEPVLNTEDGNQDPLVDIPDRAKLDQLLVHAKIYSLAGKFDQAASVLERALKLAAQYQANLAIRLAEAEIENGSNEAAASEWELAARLLPDSNLARAGRTLAKAAFGLSFDPSEIQISNKNEPLAQLALSQAMFLSGDTMHARDLARQAIQVSLQTPLGWLSNRNLLNLLPGRSYGGLLDYLISMELYPEAIQIGERILAFRPTDVDVLRELTKAYEAKGSLDKAVSAALRLTLLQPQDLQQRRVLAGLFEQIPDWGKALNERERILTQVIQLATADMLAVANCALQAGKYKRAEEVCRDAIEREPENGLAHALMGEALSNLGEEDRAMEHFTQATLLSPEQATPWLYMARAYQRAGEQQKSLEILRAAAHAASQSPEVHLALADACLANQSPSEALPALRKAAILSPRSPQIALRLGNILAELGHQVEAREVFERARQSNPTHPELAYAHGKVLLALGEPEAALVAFEIALDGQPKSIEPYIDYATTLLKRRKLQSTRFTMNTKTFNNPGAELTNQDLDSAQVRLDHGLSLDPGNLEARILQGELMELREDWERALKSFLDLSEEENKCTANQLGRIKLGLGKAALALNEMETALAALQEAALSNPDNLEVQHTLTEAYFTANLKDEALQASYRARELAPHDPQNLAWLAGAMLALGATQEAIDSLRRASELDPQRSDLQIYLGQVQMHSGDLKGARETFDAVLLNPNASSGDLQEAAHAFLKLNDPGSAVTCMERAIEKSPMPETELFQELAQLLSDRGDLEGSLDVLQRATTMYPDVADLFVQQSDVLSALGRHQAALACLEQAQQLTLTAKDTSNGHQDDFLSLQIHTRIAQLARAVGDLPIAYSHALTALNLFPNLPETHYYASELAYALADLDNARSALEWCFPKAPSSDDEIAGTPEWIRTTDTNLLRNLVCLYAELTLDAGEEQESEKVLQLVSEGQDNDARYFAVLARMRSASGEYTQAAELFDRAYEIYRSQKMTLDDEKSLFSTPIYTLASAAIDLNRWGEAADLCQRACEVRPKEPAAYLKLAQLRVRSAEQQRSAEGLHITKHQPGDEALSETSFVHFEQAIRSTAKLNNSAEVKRWFLRGQAVFKPNESNLKDFAQVARFPDDAAALIGLQRSIHKTLKNVIDVTQDHLGDARVLEELALSALTSEPEKALAYALGALNRRPSDPRSLALAAYAAWATGDNQMAYQCIAKALTIWPDEVHWQALAGELKVAEGDFQIAADHFRSALNLEPTAAEYAIKLGQIYLKDGDAHSAIQSLATAVRLAPDQPEPWIELARAHNLAGDITQALSCAEQAAALAPSRVEPVILVGELALQAGQYDQVRQQVESALELDPDNPDAILLHAHLLIKQDRSQEALSTLERAIPLLKDPLPVLIEQARLIRQTSGAQAALSKVQFIVSRYPDVFEGQQMLAEILAEMGQRENAIRAAQAALQIRSNDTGMHFLLGRLMRTSGQLDQAIHHLSAVMQGDPSCVEACLELGRVYQDRRDIPAALKVYQQAIQASPKDARPYYQAGLALRDIKDYKGAEDFLRKAAELAPEDINIRRQLGAVVAINLVHNSQEASTIS